MNLTSLAIFGIIFLFIVGIVSGAGAIYPSGGASCTSESDDAYCKNFRPINQLSCHAPLYDGWDQSLSLDSNDVDIVHNGNGTYYECGFNISGQYTARYTRDYHATAFSAIPTGWLNYVGDTITQFFFNAGAVIILIANFLTPLNFNILGYGIADISGIGAVVIIGLYAMAYLFIGAWI